MLNNEVPRVRFATCSSSSGNEMIRMGPKRTVITMPVEPPGSEYEPLVVLETTPNSYSLPTSRSYVQRLNILSCGGYSIRRSVLVQSQSRSASGRGSSP